MFSVHFDVCVQVEVCCYTLLCRVGQNRVYTPYITVCLMKSLQKNRIYTVYIWFWPTQLFCLNLSECVSAKRQHGFKSKLPHSRLGVMHKRVPVKSGCVLSYLIVCQPKDWRYFKPCGHALGEVTCCEVAVCCRTSVCASSQKDQSF